MWPSISSVPGIARPSSTPPREFVLLPSKCVVSSRRGWSPQSLGIAEVAKTTYSNGQRSPAHGKQRGCPSWSVLWPICTMF